MVVVKGSISQQNYNTINKNVFVGQEQQSQSQSQYQFTPSFQAAVARLKLKNETTIDTKKDDDIDTLNTTIQVPTVRIIQSESKWMLIFVKILFVLIILFSLPKLVTTDSKQSSTTKSKSIKLLSTTNTKNSKTPNQFNDIRMKRYECQYNPLVSDCYKIIPVEESLNCINNCISNVCYTSIYTVKEEKILEPGEINIDLAQLFELCVKNEIRQQRVVEQTKQKK